MTFDIDRWPGELKLSAASRFFRAAWNASAD